MNSGSASCGLAIHATGNQNRGSLVFSDITDVKATQLNTSILFSIFELEACDFNERSASREGSSSLDSASLHDITTVPASSLHSI